MNKKSRTLLFLLALLLLLLFEKKETIYIFLNLIKFREREKLK